ncbi:MAG: hypothetical protein QM658_08285 [Gordonia sp. (in: high G+C Gram-positive bacteria)]
MNHWRLQSRITVAAAVALILEPAFTVVTFIDDARITAAWWPPVSLLLIVCGGVAMLFGCTGRGRRRLPRAVAYTALASLAAELLWLLAWNGETKTGPVRLINWISFEVALPSLLLVAYFGMGWAVAYLVVALPLLATTQELGGYGQFGWASMVTQAITGILTLVFAAMVQVTLRRARALDVDRDRILNAAAKAAEREARQAERDRIDAVVRDRVIAVLRDMVPGAPDEASRALAADALAGMSPTTSTTLGRPLAEVDVPRAVRRVRDTIAARGDDIDVMIDADERAGAIPASVIDAVLGALDEALDNSVRHAGPRASRIAVGSLGDDGLRLRLVDDGGGFDPRRVPLDRSGVAIGIAGRMDDVPGGRGWVDSTPGEGTMVSIEWLRL